MNLDGPKIATLTGLAVGDALGMPFEMMHSLGEKILGWNGWFENSYSTITANLKAGQWTDDTKMAKALAESIADTGTYCPGVAARRYRDWYESKDLRGIGTTTDKAMTRLRAGLPWTQSGVPGSEGNGTAMRAAPLGVAFWRNVQAAAEMARIDAQITHKSEMAEQGAVAVAVGVALLIDGKWDKLDLIPKVVEWLPNGAMRSRLKEAHSKARQAQGGRHTIDLFVNMGTGAHIIQTVPAAFGIFTASKSYADAVETAVKCGGDTDTTAAVVGALAGTHYGIPQVGRYLEALEAGQELRNLEVRLLATSQPVSRTR